MYLTHATYSDPLAGFSRHTSERREWMAGGMRKKSAGKEGRGRLASLALRDGRPWNA